MGEDGRCHIVQKPKAAATLPAPAPPLTEPEKAPACRVCQQELAEAALRLRDDLGVVCAPCFVRAGTPALPPVTDVPPVAAAIKGEEPVLELDDVPREDIAVELDEEPADGDLAVDLTPDDVRAAMRSAITSAVSTIVRDETRAAFARARGRVD